MLVHEPNRVHVDDLRYSQRSLGELISKVDFDEKTQSAAAGQTQKLRALAKVRNA